MSNFAVAMLVCGGCTIASVILLVWVRGVIEDWRCKISVIHTKQREIEVSEQKMERYSRIIDTAMTRLETLVKPPVVVAKGKAKP